MSIPVNHHYLPVFYLTRWATEAEKGCVCAYQRPLNSVRVKGYHPTAIGYCKHLYAIEGRTDPVARQELESGFMSPVDSLAAEALAFMEYNNRKPDDERLRSAWSRFVLSLMFRNPERVQWLRDTIREKDSQVIKDITSSYNKLRRASNPTRFEEYRTSQGSDLLDETQALSLRTLINNPYIGLHMNNMKWVICEFKNQIHGLLTSDNPVMTSNGIGVEHGFVMLPISPAKFFLAANTDEVVSSFVDQPSKALERAINISIVNQAENLVVGHTRRHLTFIENHMGYNGSPIKQGPLNRAAWKAPI